MEGRENQEPRRFYAVSKAADEAIVSPGLFIPHGVQQLSSERPQRRLATVLAIGALAVGLAGAAATANFLAWSGETSIAAPIVVVEHPLSRERTPLSYGVEVALSQPDFFAAAREAFLTTGQSFVEADLTTMQLTYYEGGAAAFSAPIQSKGKEGSWWETPAGLYEISYKAENHFSSFGAVYQPWSMAFQGNFFIHGWPYYPDGTPVSSTFSGGCIRLADADAETLFRFVQSGTPVLVHEADFQSDGFLYEPKIPELETPYYLIADIESNTVLAASDLAASAPIASLTKLMTALIAAEHINLDKNVSTQQLAAVPSLIPRLSERSTVSMYSLLQLLLVESSNEAAEVIAAQVGRDRFIERMNEKATAIGMEHTVFTDPSGLDAGNVASLADLLRLTQYIFHNRSFILELTKNADLPTAYRRGDFGALVNFNEVAGIESFIGGKVGETLAAGQTSISLHELMIKGEPRVIAIILLGANDRASDVTELLEYMKERFGR